MKNLIFSLIPILFFSCSKFNSQINIIKVCKTKGLVMLLDKAGTEKKVVSSMLLTPGQTIATKENSQCLIQIGEDQAVMINRNTKINIKNALR